jgi:hypothetical protein
MGGLKYNANKKLEGNDLRLLETEEDCTASRGSQWTVVLEKKNA